jgi:DNA polymerase-1
MIGLAVSHDGAEADYVTDADAWAFLLPEPEQTVVFHNAKFDLAVLERTGLPLPSQWEDTLIAAHLLDENDRHGLKHLAKKHLGVEPLTFDEVDRMRLFDPDVFDEYARNDARYTHRLWALFRPELEEQGLLEVYELEKRLVPAVLAMERAGMKVDLGLLKTLGAETAAELERRRSEIFDLAECRFDLNSAQKMAAVLYDKLGLVCRRETETGQRSVDKAALEDLSGQHPIVPALLAYREVDKLASTFINVLPGYADEAGRIHPEFDSLGARTGRFSCRNPNAQQIPARSALGKRLRDAFVAGEGNKLITADYSQMELRVLAHYSRDPLLMEAYTAAEETDLHLLTASRMFSKPAGDVTKTQRTIAKMINFGIAYGISALGLYRRLHAAGAEVAQEECQRFIDAYFRTYPEVLEFLRKAERRVKDRGYVTNLFGRRRRLSGRSNREVRQAQNYIIQSSAADICKLALAELHDVLPAPARIIAQIHDELVIECPAGQADEVRDLAIQVMERRPIGFEVPLRVDGKICDRWGDSK